jgi:predicted metal-dependent hydrolase
MKATVRNLRFDLSGVPRHWHGGRKSVTSFLDGLSIFFPAGERFFVASVRAFQHCVTDAELAKEVRTFCGQEGVHSREHARYNEHLEKQGYPAFELEQNVRARLDAVAKRSPPLSQLALTCALEHFTALLGNLALVDPRVFDGADPTMAALWKWHAAEENEHKAVAYDVYRAAGGGYVRRVLVMIGATLVFWTTVVRHQAAMMRADGTRGSMSEWRALGRFLFVDPGGMASLLRPYLEYFRPGFHPSDIDTSEFVEKWEREYDASPGYAGPRAA